MTLLQRAPVSGLRSTTIHAAAAAALPPPPLPPARRPRSGVRALARPPQQQQQQQQQLQQRDLWLAAGSGDSSGSKPSSGDSGDSGSANGGSGSGGPPPLPPGKQDVIQNLEVLVGDLIALVCFTLYKQITALIFLPTFPGWLAPLALNPVRFLEFFSFSATLLGCWAGAGMLAGGYRYSATADVTTALRTTSVMWLISMPVAAAQLVLLTAAEDGSLVGAEGFARALPLAASGPGEPFVTAAGVLGLMSVWRAFYAAYLDVHSFRSVPALRRDREKDMQHFADSLRAGMLLSLACCAVLQGLQALVGEEQLELMAAALLRR